MAVWTVADGIGGACMARASLVLDYCRGMINLLVLDEDATFPLVVDLRGPCGGTKDVSE